MKWPWWVGAAVVVAIGVGAWMVAPSAKKGAIAACRSAVAGQLLSPATAKFSGETIVGDSPWFFLVDVDSQNAKGALVRSKWACSVTHADGRYDARAEIAR